MKAFPWKFDYEMKDFLYSSIDIFFKHISKLMDFVKIKGFALKCQSNQKVFFSNLIEVKRFPLNLDRKLKDFLVKINRDVSKQN